MTMPAERDGVVTVEGGRAVIRFERRLRHPVERVWDALTRPERIAEWFGEGEVHLELVPGGEYRTRTTGPPELVEAIVSVAGEEGLEQRNTVLAVEPPTLLESHLRRRPGVGACAGSCGPMTTAAASRSGT